MAKALVSTAALWLCLIPRFSVSGDMPFYPSAINTATGLPAAVEEFTPAEQCAYCHPVQYDQWKGSLHANAFRDPLYQAVWKEAARAAGPRLDRLCAGCHTPVGTTTEQVWVRTSGEVIIHPVAEEGVTCDFCHSVEKVVPIEPGGGPGNAGLIVDPRGPKRGPYFDAHSTFHDTQFSDLHTRSEFCAACHNVFHPTTGTSIVRTYDEWKNSPYAEAEIHCQDCHMVPPEVASQVAADLEKPVLTGVTSTFGTERSPFFLHLFTGANAAIQSLLGYYTHAGEARMRLQQAARVRVKAEGPAIPGRTLDLAVRIRNVGAGHNLPTGMTEIRQMWLHVTVTDVGAGGVTIWQRGALDGNGRLDPAASTYGAKAVDAQGNPTWKPWEVAGIEADTSIPPRAQVLETYRIPIPDSASGPIRMTATLMYRSFPQHVADQYLGVQGYRVPLVEMASDANVIDVSTP